jgi:2-oxoglutarate dehydrogenase E1 component
MFTQPLMYKAIRQHKNAHQQYVERLLADGSLSKAEVRLLHHSAAMLLHRAAAGA